MTNKTQSNNSDAQPAPAQQPEALPLALECADYATSLRSVIMLAKLEQRAEPASMVRAAGLFERAAAYIAELEAMQAAPPAPAAVAVPDGFALMPKRLTRAMERVLSADEEGWQWEDLLAAAEAITEEEYAALAAAPAQEHATQLACQNQEARPGFALVPLRLTRAMEKVLQEEDWQWADLLAEAGALNTADFDALSRDDLTDTEVFAVADPLFAHQQIGGRVPSQDLDGFREVIGSALSDAVFQRTAPAQAQEDAPVIRAGLLAAAAHIRSKASSHAEECGSYDPDTGAFEMHDAVQDHYNTLDELAEEIRLMADKAAPASCDKPPAGWACSRAPGHIGPCAAARAPQGGA